MRIVIALIWLVIVSVAFGQAPIQRNTFTTNSNPVFKGNSNVVYSNINSTVTYEFFGDTATQSNRVMRSGDMLWTNFSKADIEGGFIQGIADKNPLGSVASLAVNFLPVFWGQETDVISIGIRAGRGGNAGTNSVHTFNIGPDTGFNQNLIRSDNIFNLGASSGQAQVISNSSYCYNLGPSVGDSQRITNSIGIINMGYGAGSSARITNGQNIFNFGLYPGRNTLLSGASSMFNFGYYSGSSLKGNTVDALFNYGYEAGGSVSVGVEATNSKSIFNYGYQAGYRDVLLNSTNLYAYGTYTASNLVASGANRLYFYGAYSGESARMTNAGDVYGFGSYALRDAHVVLSTNITGFGNDAFEHAHLTNANNLTALGFEAGENTKLTNSSFITLIGNTAGTNMVGSYTNVTAIGEGVTWNDSGQVSIAGPGQTTVINNALTNVGIASFRTNTLTYGTNEGRWQVLHGNAHTNSLFDDQYLTAVNPDAGFNSLAQDAGVGDWKLVSTRYQVNPGNRDNIVFRDGYNPTREITNDVTACQTFETVWYPDGPAGRRQCEWYFSFSDTRTPWADNRKIAVNFNATNVLESRTALLDTRVDISGETTYFTDREGTNFYAQVEDVNLGEGGQFTFYGIAQLSPYLPPDGVHTATYLRFNGTNVNKATLVRQDDETLLFERADASTAGRIVFDDMRQVVTPSGTNISSYTIITNGLGVGTNLLGGLVHISVSNDAVALMITKTKIDTGANLIEARNTSGTTIFQVNDNSQIRGGSLLTYDLGLAANYNGTGIVGIKNDGVLGFTDLWASNPIDTAFSRVEARNMALGNGTQGNIAATLTTSNANFAGSITVTQQVNIKHTAVSLIADNQSVSATNCSYIRLSSDDGTAGNRTFVLSSGTVDGQLLDLEWTGTNAGEIVDDFSATGGGNGRLSATWTPTQYDVLSLRWNGTDWIERGRSTN